MNIVDIAERDDVSLARLIGILVRVTGTLAVSLLCVPFAKDRRASLHASLQSDASVARTGTEAGTPREPRVRPTSARFAQRSLHGAENRRAERGIGRLC